MEEERYKAYHIFCQTLWTLVCLAASGTGSQVVTDQAAAKRCSRMNSDMDMDLNFLIRFSLMLHTDRTVLNGQ